MTDILSQLPLASFREIEFHVAASSYDFVQEQARHKLIYQNGSLIESLGRDAPAYRYTIPFRENIYRGGIPNMFTVVYPQFLAACQDDSRGILDDPFHGALPARCVRLSEVRDSGKRDGIDVEAEFVHAPYLDDFLTDLGTRIETLQGNKASASLFDQESAKVDWKQEPPPEAALDPLDTATSVTNQLETAGGKVTAQMENLSFRMNRAATSIDRVKNPNLAPLRTAAVRLNLAALRLHQSATAPPRPRKVVRAARDIGRLAFASLHRMTVEDLIRLNPVLATRQFIKRNDPVSIYRDAAP